MEDCRPAEVGLHNEWPIQSSSRQVKDNQLETLQSGPEGALRPDDPARSQPTVLRPGQRQAQTHSLFLECGDPVLPDTAPGNGCGRKPA